MNNKMLTRTFRNTSAAIIYIFIVSQIMQNGNKLFGEVDSFLSPFVVLLLFSLSAAIVGGLVFGYSILLFIEGKKGECILASFYSIGWLGVYTVLSLVILFLLSR